MEEEREITQGDKVRLRLNPHLSTLGITPELMEYDGGTFRVKRIRKVKAAASSIYKGVYYELKGCVSAEGVPFAILREWLQPI